MSPASSPRRRPGAGRLLARLALAALALLGIAWLGALAAVAVAASRDGARPATAIIVLGAAQYDGRPSPVLRARLDHAVALWHRGLAPRLIVTGGRRAGDRTSEAATGRRYAVAHGVPDSAILMESEGRTTAESLRAAAALLAELERTAGQHHASSAPGARQDDPRAAILVSDPFHMLRLGILARRYGIVPYTSPTRTSPISAHRTAALGYMVRESVKIPVVWLMETGADEGSGR
ncbi:YdcF family protein [Roseisolibacter sp. H3M3-2]|uniref:YdcF family protein n=1 Tax=Roseisolibacter sp. H3M3-2 TaxID=3031323 RepID=UPI0023DB473D|nr:YdcF family protein [Roseisolibacter sp. H3M3-2]MDF1501766.1 YdcF family protein [Roseisolibacter sp. H3M3-2]